MPKANLLSAQTTEFLSLVGNGKTFRVPRYQRDYSWDEEQWEDLWTDLLELRRQPDDRHYMGAIVVEATSTREYKIIDGQQRIATLSVAILAVIDRLQQIADAGIEPDDNRQRALQLRGRFIGEKDPASLVEASKLALNETDDGFYQDYLVALREPVSMRGAPRSNRRLWECFLWFRARLLETPDLRNDGLALATLVSEVIARRLLFIHIAVDDEMSAYTVFETLNARGLELSATDLLKNYLFSRIKTAADLDAIHRRWNRLLGVVFQERFPEFLRYHLLCTEPRVRSPRLFKMVRDRVKDGRSAFEFIAELEARAEIFAALSDADHALWAERQGCRRFVRELNAFRVRQMTPLLFAAYERLDPPTFESVLRTVWVIAFRHSIAAGAGGSVLEPAYHRAARAVLEGAAVTAAQVFDCLRSIYVPDSRFRTDFAQLAIDTAGQNKRVVRSILAQLEADASGASVTADDPFSIEHILPEQPAPAWDATFPAGRADACVYRIGNLLPLEIARNRDVGNADFRTKLERYQSSQYRLPRQLAEFAPTEWSPELLDRWQARLADRAVHLWRVPYPT